VLYINVAKVDRDVAHYVMAIHYVSSVCSKYFICSKCMLQVFYLDVAIEDLDVVYICMLQTYVPSVFRCFIYIFASVSSKCCICLQLISNIFRCFYKYFRLLFQVFHLSHFVCYNYCT
jgi:hypothetical protein